MAGRTVSKWTRFVVSDSAGTLREIPIDSINGVGLTYDQTDLTAFQDALKGVLPNLPDAQVTITGPFDNSAATTVAGSGAAPALSGSHTVLNAIVGGVTPLSLGVYIGIQGYWATGSPTWGVSKTTASGFLCVEYTVNPQSMKYSAKFRMFPGSSAPAWGTAAVT